MIRISGKIPINIYPVFWVIALLIGWINTSWMTSISTIMIATLLWVVVIFVSILFHEFGHALTAILFGQNARIDLVGFGGMTQRFGKNIKLWQDFIVVMNGPLFGFSLGIIAYVIQKSFFAANEASWITYSLQVAVWVNIFWTILNLLPVIPLDGGRLMSIIFEGIFGFKGVKLAYFVSIILATLLAIFFFAIQQLLVGGLFLLMAYESYKGWRASMGMTEQDQDATLRVRLKRSEELLRNNHKDDAIKELEQLRAQAKAGVIYNTATQLLADLYYDQGKYQNTFDLLSPIKNEIDAPALRLLHQSAYHTGNLKAAIELGDRSYHAYPSYDTALINAFCYALQGLERPAIGWLQCSIREGLPNVNEVLQKQDFDKIRNLPLFQQLLNTTSHT